MARRKRSRKHKNRNNRNHFSSGGSDSKETQIFLEFNVPRNASNFISTLEETVLILNDRCSETPKELEINDCLVQCDTRFRSHSCVSKFHSSVEQKCITLPETDDIVETPKRLYNRAIYSTICNEDVQLVETIVNLENKRSTSENLIFVDALDSLAEGSDYYIDEYATSTPLSPTTLHNSTQTDFEHTANNLGPKRPKGRNSLPTYKVRIKNCDVSLRNLYCNQIRAPTEIRAFKNCVQVITSLQEFHANYTYHLGKKVVEVCCWLGTTFTSGFTTVYQLYQDHRMCNILRYEISTLNETIKALVIDNALLRTEFHNIKQELKEIKEGRTLQGVCAQAPPAPPPPPPPPPPLPPIMQSTNTLKANIPKVFRKKIQEQNSRPIISLDDILKVKLRKTAERPSLRRITDPLVSNTLKNITLRPTSSRALTCSSVETPSTESSLSNSPQTSLTRLLMTVDSKVRRVKRLQRQNSYISNDFSRASPQSQRDRRYYSFAPVS